MLNQWFKWEREAQVHLLYPTLEGSMQPLNDYTGFSFPTTTLIFQDGVVSWCMLQKEFDKLGENLRGVFKDKNKEKKLVRDIKSSTEDLQKVERELDRENLNSLNNTELLNLYRNLYQKFLIFYSIGAISSPLSLETEKYLKEKVGLSDKQLNILAKPKRDSYSKEAEKYLLETKNITGFTKKYFWIDNNYSSVRNLTLQDIQQRLNSLKSTETKNNKLTKIGRISLSAQERRLIELLRNYALYKDDRKKNILIFLHYYNELLKEIATRSRLNLEEIYYCFPFEIRKILNFKISKKEINQRKKLCVVLWRKGVIRPRILVGEEAQKISSRFLLDKLIETKIIHGSVASPGKTTGRVRVLYTSKDCYKLKQGEVLVTFMTSPDFMEAIRKASAIVTNLGGVTSHAAIISRELTIPCIVGTKIATQVLKTGDLVEVDANEGEIKILS